MFNDEALDINDTMQLVAWGELRYPSRKPLYLLGKAYPIMLSETMGPIYMYSVLPFYYIFGVGLLAARLLPITFGLATLILNFQLGKALFSRRVACISTALLSVFPSFVQWTRIGVFCTSILNFLTMGTLVFLFRWVRTSRTRFLLLTALFVGLGFSSKANYYRFTVDLIILYLLWRPRLRPTLSQVILSALVFVIGAFPFILYNTVIDPLATPRFAIANLNTSVYGTSNIELPKNLLMRMSQFTVLLEGSTFSGVVGTNISNPLYPVTFGILTIGLVMTFARKSADPARKKRGMVICLLLVLLLLESLYTTSNFGMHHLIIIMPLPQLIVAEALDITLFRRLMPLERTRTRAHRRRALFMAGLVLVVILIGADLSVNIEYHRSLQRTGGVGLFSDAVYDLANYCVRFNISRPIAVDWGFSQLGVLTGGKVYPEEIFGYPDWKGFVDASTFIKTVQACLANASNIYLFHTPAYTTIRGLDRFAQFQEIATRMNKTLVLLKVFCQRDGRPVILVYQAV